MTARNRGRVPAQDMPTTRLPVIGEAEYLHFFKLIFRVLLCGPSRFRQISGFRLHLRSFFNLAML